MNDARDIAAAVARTAFVTAALSLLLAWAAELVRPGSVSRFLSLHLFLLAAALAAAWHAATVSRYRDRPLAQYALALALMPAAGYAAWRLGGGFGELRVLAAALACAIPPVLVPLIRSSSSS